MLLLLVVVLFLRLNDVPSDKILTILPFATAAALGPVGEAAKAEVVNVLLPKSCRGWW